jgi:hypothetical protein
MATLANIVIAGDEWVSVNTLTGIPIGTGFFLQNISATAGAILQEKTTQPLAASRDGQRMSPMTGSYAWATIYAGGDEVWAKATNIDGSVTLSVVL